MGRHVISAKHCILLAFSALPWGGLLAHPGPLDINGGHYDGMSYHCHLSNCEQPDSFNRSGPDSFFLDQDSREKFFNEIDWSVDHDFDGDCQNTRNEILVLTSLAEVRYTNPRNCEVRTGQWLDYLTGKTFTVAAQMELGHIIPPLYAHNQGGDAWPPQKKLAFANDPLNLVMTERGEQRRRRDRGPSRYLPTEEYQCDYVRQWEAIAEKYDLRIDNRDRGQIRRVLEGCTDD